MPKRSYSAAGSYRYGFGGQEMNNDVKGLGNSYTAEFWEYDTRIGRRWNIDPMHKEGESDYSVLGNSPLLNVDPLGKDWYENNKGERFWSKSTEKTIQYNNSTWNNIGAINYENQTIDGVEYRSVYNQNKLVYFGEYRGTVSPITALKCHPGKAYLEREHDRILQEYLKLDHAHGQHFFPRSQFWESVLGPRGYNGYKITKDGYLTSEMLPLAGTPPMVGFKIGGAFRILGSDVQMDIVAADWATKGAHLKIFDKLGKPIELALRPDDKGSIIIRSVFSSQSASRVANAEKSVEMLLKGNSVFRQEVIDKVTKTKEMFRTGTDLERASAGELHFLLKALKKMK